MVRINIEKDRAIWDIHDDAWLSRLGFPCSVRACAVPMYDKSTYQIRSDHRKKIVVAEGGHER